jgi:hypothetical protein
MKLSHVALLLALLLVTGRTTNVLATDDTLAADQTAFLPFASQDTFQQAHPFQSPIRKFNNETAAIATTLYDTYYSNVNIAGTDGQSASHSTLVRGFQRYMSQVAANGNTALGYASYCLEQATKLLRYHGLNDEQAGLETADVFAYWVEMAETTSSENAESTANAKARRSEPVECLYVACNTRNDSSALLGTLGKVTVEYPLGSPSRSALIAEFYWADEEFCPTLASNVRFGNPWQFHIGNPDEDRTDSRQATASSIVTRLATWVQGSLDGWDVAFRNISRQIARLDWTLSLKSQSADRAVRNTAPASNPINR